MLDANMTFGGQIEEREFGGRKYLYRPKLSANGGVAREHGLIVVMSTHNNGDRYFALDALRKFDRSSLLFVTDPENSYYLGTKEGGSYDQLFDCCLANYDPESITFFGSSMAGYGALYHAVRLNANAIASNPQVNFDVTEKYGWQALRNTIGKLHRRIDLDEWMPGNYKQSAIHVIHGQNELDLANLDCLLRAKVTNRLIGLSAVDDDRHGFYINDFSVIFDLHDHLRGLRRLVPFSPNQRAMIRIAADGALNV